MDLDWDSLETYLSSDFINYYEELVLVGWHFNTTVMKNTNTKMSFENRRDSFCKGIFKSFYEDKQMCGSIMDDCRTPDYVVALINLINYEHTKKEPKMNWNKLKENRFGLL